MCLKLTEGPADHHQESISIYPPVVVLRRRRIVASARDIGVVDPARWRVTPERFIIACCLLYSTFYMVVRLDVMGRVELVRNVMSFI
jgi:hypothetical protein